MARPAQPGRKPFPRRKKIIWTVLLLAFLGYVGVTYRAIARQAEVDETRKADVIVVFGAAEYAGRPSPVYRARLEHAVALYQQGVAPFIITTGGAGEDPKFSEGGVGKDFIVSFGVPENNVIAETQGTDTAESAARIANIMRSNNFSTCVAVSDPYHMFRIKFLLGREGVHVYGAPRPLLHPLTERQKVIYYLREVLSITLWRLHVR
jgi:uncharacterized SAM-binding protein YcdF (DUF218 family)